MAIILLLLILLLLGGGGFVFHVLWYALVFALILWFAGFIMGAFESGFWSGHHHSP